MRKDEVLKLIDAGFTREEILALEEDADLIPEETAEEEVPAEEPAPAADHFESPESMYQQMMQQLQETLNAGLKGIQTANIRGADQPEVKQDTPEDMIARIIAPTVKAKNK